MRLVPNLVSLNIAPLFAVTEFVDLATIATDLLSEAREQKQWQIMVDQRTKNAVLSTLAYQLAVCNRQQNEPASKAIALAMSRV